MQNIVWMLFKYLVTQPKGRTR